MNPAAPITGLPPSTPLRKAVFGRSAMRIGRAAQALAAILIGLAGISAASGQALYSVTDLGVPPGYTSCAAARLNDRGDVVGSCVNASTADAFVWRKDGNISAIGKLSGGNYSYATAINSLGAITGDGDTGNFRPQSWVTTATPGVLLNIFPNSGGNTHTLFIGDNGMIGGYYTKSLSGNTSSWKGAIWTPDPKDPRKYRTTDLPILPGGFDKKASFAIPFAFNQSGQAAGYAQTDQIGHHATLWNNDPAHSIVDLGVFGDDWSSMAYGMNDFGQVVGISNPPFGNRPVLWNNDAAHTPFALPPLPGDNYGGAIAINNAGHIIGSSYYGTPGTWGATPARAVVWRDSSVFELQSLLDAATGAGWTLSVATAINNLGQIVGSGVLNGEARAILLTPLPQ